MNGRSKKKARETHTKELETIHIDVFDRNNGRMFIRFDYSFLPKFFRHAYSELIHTKWVTYNVITARISMNKKNHLNTLKKEIHGFDISIVDLIHRSNLC